MNFMRQLPDSSFIYDAKAFHAFGFSKTDYHNE